MVVKHNNIIFYIHCLIITISYKTKDLVFWSIKKTNKSDNSFSLKSNSKLKMLKLMKPLPLEAISNPNNNLFSIYTALFSHRHNEIQILPHRKI